MEFVMQLDKLKQIKTKYILTKYILIIYISNLITIIKNINSNNGVM